MIKWLKHPVVSKIHDIIQESHILGNVLGIGSSPQEKDILNLPCFQNCKDDISLIGINISGKFGHYGNFKIIEANAHSIPFNNNHFDLIICNAMLEHDSEFWLTIVEVNRVLKNGGLFIVNTPGYTNGETNVEDATLTYKIHGDDYYRFSEKSFRDVIFKGLNNVQIEAVMVPPRIIRWGNKNGK